MTSQYEADDGQLTPDQINQIKKLAQANSRAIPVTIKVSGPGTCFDLEFETTRLALIEAGIEVEVINEFPPEDVEMTMARLKKLQSEGKKFKVTLIADHQPWGG